ncbi:MAG TPA: hypothetical protein EYP04_05515 [Anaerolineae bacterium]|nr:hypothetical protein [Anaerolineae bacterium]HIQ04163.1 hypothetical protein [Anaerolineae bacterium]
MTAQTQTITQTSSRPLSFAAWLTLERAAWLGILLLAAAIRFIGLGAHPLEPFEAQTAWAAWRISQGLSLNQATLKGLSPLLLGGQVVLFFLVGASDALARFWPALAGTVLVLLPYGLCRQLGRGGALAAGLLLALSATTTYFSRHADGAVLAVAAGTSLLVVLIRPARIGGERGRLIWAGIAAVLVLLADIPVAWWPQLGSDAGRPPFYWPLWHLLLDDPLVAVVGVAGAVVAWRRRDRLGVILTVWAGVALLVGMLLPARRTVEHLYAVVPLALLAGPAVARFLVDVWERLRFQWVEAALLGLASLALLVTLGIWLTDYSRLGEAQFLMAALVPFLFVAIVPLAYGFWVGWEVTGRIMGLVALVVLLLLTINFSWALSLDTDVYRHPALLPATTTYGPRLLQRELRKLSSQRLGDPRDLVVDVQVEADSPLLRWYLRDFRGVRYVGGLDPATAGIAVITPLRESVPLGEAYSGDRIPLTAIFSPAELRGANLVRWLLYRRWEGDMAQNEVVLWVKQESATQK